METIDLHSKSMEWFLYDRGLLQERVKASSSTVRQFPGVLQTLLLKNSQNSQKADCDGVVY